MQGDEAPTGIINSANNLTINTDTVTNNSSSIYAGNDMVLKVGTVDNISNMFRDYVRYRVNGHNTTYGSDQYWYIGTKAVNGVNYINKPTTITANIKAGNNFIGVATGDVNNTTTEHTAANFSCTHHQFSYTCHNRVDIPTGTKTIVGTGGGVEEQSSAILSIEDESAQIVNGIDLDNVVSSGVVSKDLSSYINGPDNQGMFQKNTNPNTPLFETRSQFVDQSKFFGSDYFYQKIGLNLTDVQTEFEQQNKRLVGDQFFQAKIIEEQLKTIRKNALLLSDSGTNANTETQSLLDNAADEYTRLGLTANETLTQTQIDSLEKDIVWFETETINGELYVVPKIYLTKATRDSLNNNDSLTTKSTIMAMGDLQLNSDSLTNSGSVIGNNVTVTTTNDITNNNFSDIIATNGLNLTSNSGSIINFSKLKAGGAVSLTAANNITNTATVKTNAVNLLDSDSLAYISNGSVASNSGNISSTLIETALIEAGSFTANAGNDFSNYGADITTTIGDLNITAGDDIRIETVQLRDRSELRAKKYTKITDTTTNISSNITSAGGITLTTNGTGTDNEAGTSGLGVGSSILVSGSNVSAVNDLNLSANNNVIITNAVDSDYSFEQTTKKGSLKTSRTTRTDYVETAVSSNLNSKNINIVSNSNIYVQGSDLNSQFDELTNTGGNTNLTAGNDAIITNATLREYHHSSKSVSNRGVFKGITAITSAVMGSVMAAVQVGINLTNATAKLYGQEDAAKKVSRGIKKNNRENQYYTTKTRTINKNDLTKIVASNVEAGNNLSITSTNMTMIQASNLASGTADNDNTNPSVTGNLNITSKDLSVFAATSQNIKTTDQRFGTTFSIKNQTIGNMSTGLVNSSLTAKNDNFSYNIANKADIRAKDLNSPSISDPSYVTALKTQLAPEKINEVTLEIMNKHWEDTSRELTDAAIATAAIVIVVATIVTAGAAAAAVGAAAGAAAVGASATVAVGATAAGASAAAGATMAAAVTVGASATMAATVATVTQAAILATLSTAAVTVGTTAMNASMNADGDMWKQAKGISKTTWDESTSRDAFESYIIAATTAALTAGATSGLDSATNSAVAANNAGNATFSQRILVSLADSNIASAIAESAISTTASTAAQSAINGESFGDSLENQAENILIGAVANVGAKAIGTNYKTSAQTGADKAIQLTSHAALGAGVSALTGNDALSGAVSAVVGEVAGEVTLNNFDVSETAIKEIAGLAGGYSAIFTGNAIGLSDSEVSDNMFSGQRIGKNAAENNLLYAAARDLATRNRDGELVGSNSLGTHQFSILAPDNPEDFTPELLKEIGVPPMQDLGNGTMGWVTGAHKVQTSDNSNIFLLNAKFNEPADFSAAQQFINPKKYVSWIKPDFDTEAYKVKHPGLTDTQVITNALQNTVNYQHNMVSTPYPKDRDTLTQSFKYTNIINSNSWNQSILKYSGATGYPNDFKGVDVGRQTPISQNYFKSINAQQ
jgi:hypothetical protein